ncbi:MAG: hypothetical protein BWZ07_02355 [Alphaproteobacteria bacterium ADurb.BinA280]|nr:MAG: hypothetical protein BWZ07_02355 [Alphaproteobacteria bacterium ADurb.BinA280]
MGQASGKCQQGFPGACRSKQCDKVDVGIHQSVERKVLLAVSCGDAPNLMACAAVVVHHLQHATLGVAINHAKLDLIIARKIQKLVGTPSFIRHWANFIAGLAAFDPRPKIAFVSIPKIHRKLSRPTVEQIEIIKRPIILVVFGRNPRDGCLDAHVDVFGHQHDFRARALLAQPDDRQQDLIVPARITLVPRHTFAIRLKEQPADIAVRAQVQRLWAQQTESLMDIACAVSFNQFVDESTHLARIAGNFGRTLLPRVEFFQHGHWKIDVVLFEFEQCRRVMHQHVGVEHVDPLAVSHHRKAPLRRRSGV